MIRVDVFEPDSQRGKIGEAPTDSTTSPRAPNWTVLEQISAGRGLAGRPKQAPCEDPARRLPASSALRSIPVLGSSATPRAAEQTGTHEDHVPRALPGQPVAPLGCRRHDWCLPSSEGDDGSLCEGR